MIVVSGEALIDLIPTPTGELKVSVGGAPFNTARWLGRLGQPVRFLGAIAADPLGRQIRRSLIECDVALDLVVDAPHLTTLALAQLDATGAAQYTFYSDATSVRDLTPESLPDNVMDGVDAIQVGGVGLTLEPSATAVELLVQRAHAAGALVMLDPNVRPTLVDDPVAYTERLARVVALTDVVKLSVDDVRWIAPDDDPVTRARVLLSSGPRAVLLTDGANGTTVLTADLTKIVPAEPVTVVDTIGAGDAFGAGFLAHWLANGRARADLNDSALVVEAARHATAVAGIACAHPGGTPPADLQQLLH